MRKNVIVFLMAIAGFAMTGFAQSSEIEISIGTGTTLNYWPVDFRRNNSASQTLYWATEMGINCGNITGLTWYAQTNEDYTSGEVIQMWIGETDILFFPNTSAWLPVSEMTKVFDGAITLSTASPNVDVEFSTPYSYTGRNLVVYVVKLDTGWTSGKQFRQNTSNGWSRTITRSLDQHGAITPENPGQGSMITTFPNVTFHVDMSDMGSISGTVSDKNGAIEGVTVGIDGYTFVATTDAEGDYEFPYLNPGAYTLTATLPPYEDATAEATVTAGASTTVDITMAIPLPEVTVSGTVTGADDGNPIEGASVTFSGVSVFEAVTDATGAYSIAEVLGDNSYEMTVAAEGYETYTSTVEVADEDVTANAGLNEIALPVELPTATLSDDKNSVEVKWYAPGTAPDMPKTYTLDDGTAEDGWTAIPNAMMNIGNWFITQDEGRVQSVDLYFIENPEASGRTLRVDIYSPPPRQLIASSALFTPLADSWINVPLLTEAEYSGDFYVMVRWEKDEAGRTHWLGYDQTGPYAGASLDMTLEITNLGGMNWGLLNFEASCPPGVLMIRANAMVSGEAKSYGYQAEQTAYRRSKPSESLTASIQAERMNPEVPVAAGNPPAVTGTKAPKALQNYSVYRLLSGQETAESEWDLAGTTADTSYTDNQWSTLPQGLYRYAVKASYSALVSDAVITNAISRNMEARVVVALNTNSGDPVSGASIVLTGRDGNPEHVYQATAGSNDVIFPVVWKGMYDISVRLDGFAPYHNEEVIEIEGDQTIHVNLTEIIVTPHTLTVEPTDNPANWNFLWSTQIETFEDDVESYGNFIIDNIGEYTQVDLDGSETYGIEGLNWPNMNYAGSFMVFNPSQAGYGMLNEASMPHSGDRYLACFSATSPPNNDWLILPKIMIVNGFKLSFWAKSYTFEYGLERMKVAVSTTGTSAPDDFTVISSGNYIEVPVEWTEYTYDLSEYAGQEIHLAINCVSNDALFLMLDDLYVGMESSKSGKALENYVVYLDEEQITTTEEAQHLFEGLENGTYKAGVKAVYSSGESEIAYSAPFTVNVPDPEYTVTFNITNEDGEPIEDATIVFNGETLDGYIAGGVTAGEYDYTVSKTGYTTATGTVEVIDRNVTEEVTLGTVGINSNSLATIHLHPNPFTDEITVSNPAAVRNIQITDAAGQKVKDVILSGKTISTGELPSGVYFVTIETVTGEKAVYKMVKK